MYKYSICTNASVRYMIQLEVGGCLIYWHTIVYTAAYRLVSMYMYAVSCVDAEQVQCSACTMPRCVSVCMYVVCIMSASIHTCRCALSYEWTVFYSTYCSYVCLRCIWIWMTSHCTVSDCQSSWCETTRPQRSLLNSVLTHTHSHSQTLIYINKLNVH